MSDVPDDGLNTDEFAGAESVRLVRVVVPAALAEIVSDRFWQVGVRGVSEIELDDGRVEVTSSVGDDQDAIDRTIATFDADWEWSVDDVDAAPGDSWKQFAEPVWFRPDRVLTPAWIDPAAIAGVERATTVTTIEPGSAFGLGDHPTTRSSLSLLASALETADPVVDDVLDVGCGTGVLSAFAAQCGVRRVRAIDVAHAAVAATRDNARRNGVEHLVEVDATPVGEMIGTYDLVVANILAPVLVSIAPDLRRLTAPGGRLIVSGVLERRHDHVLRALAPMRPVDQLVDEGWITVALRH